MLLGVGPIGKKFIFLLRAPWLAVLWVYSSNPRIYYFGIRDVNVVAATAEQKTTMRRDAEAIVGQFFWITFNGDCPYSVIHKVLLVKLCLLSRHDVGQHFPCLWMFSRRVCATFYLFTPVVSKLVITLSLVAGRPVGIPFKLADTPFRH